MSAVDDVRKQLDQGYPDTWRFDENGPEIIGHAIRLEVGQTQNGPVDILVVQHAENGTLYSVWLMHESLRNKLFRMKPKAGDLLGIRQVGERVSTRSGRTYMDYNVVVAGVTGNELAWHEPAALEAGDAEVADAEVVEQGRVDRPPASAYSDDW